MEQIQLSTRTHSSDFYDRSRDIETALAWHALKKTLTELGREDLFGYIKSIKVTEKTITIITGKPIVNEEFLSLRQYFEKEIASSQVSLGKKHTLRLRFM